MDKTMNVHAKWHDIRIRHIRVRTRTCSNSAYRQYYVLCLGIRFLKNRMLISTVQLIITAGRLVESGSVLFFLKNILRVVQYRFVITKSIKL
jgi:hypothetical protein